MRPLRTDRISAVVVVEDGLERKEMRLLDLLRRHVSDAALFDKLGAMMVGESFELGPSGSRVTRIR